MLAPTYNRTVSLILEDDYNTYAQGTGNKGFSTDLLNRYFPAQGRISSSPTQTTPKTTSTLRDITGGFINLRSVYSIVVRNEAGVATDNGLFTSFIQPWFIKPKTIDIKGTTYLGAYPLISNKDREGERLLNLYTQILNDFSPATGSPGTRKKVVLILNGYPTYAKTFTGYITSLTFTETVENANLVDFTLSFVGRPYEAQAQKNGNASGQQSANGAPPIKPDSSNIIDTPVTPGTPSPVIGSPQNII